MNWNTSICSRAIKYMTGNLDLIELYDKTESVTNLFITLIDWERETVQNRSEGELIQICG